MKKISPTNSKVLYGSRPLILANGLDSAVVKIRLRDEDNNPINERQAQIIVDRDDVTVVQPNLSDNTGLGIGYIGTKTIGPVTVRVRALSPDNPRILSSPEALQELDKNSPGTVWLEDTITVNFYARDIEPKPVLESTAGRNIHIMWLTSRHYMNDIDGIRVRIEADDANLMPTKIFAYQMLPVKPGDTEQLAAFDHVCSAVDLEEYPEDAADENSRPAWFRADYVDVFLRSKEEVRAFIAAVLEDIQILKNTLDIADDLSEGGELWIGDELVIE